MAGGATIAGSIAVGVAAHDGNLVLGVLFKDPSLPGGLLALAATLALIATAKADEAECTRFFGPAYRDYMQRTRMFVPFLF